MTTDDDQKPKHLSKQEFGESLKRRMVERGIDHAELARRADLPRNNISTYINGRAFPGEQSLQKLAAVLDCTPDDLLPGRTALVLAGDGFPDLSVTRATTENTKGYSWLNVHRLVPDEIARLIVNILNNPPPTPADE